VKQDPANFDPRRKKSPATTTTALCAAARKNKVVVVGSLFENRGSEVYHNTAVVIDADGTLLGSYRQRITSRKTLPLRRNFIFTPATSLRAGRPRRHNRRTHLLDQWYPEARTPHCFCAVRMFLIYPTASVGSPRKKPRSAPPSTTPGKPSSAPCRRHGCYVAAINRRGREGDTGNSGGQSFRSQPRTASSSPRVVNKEEIPTPIPIGKCRLIPPHLALLP